MPVGAAVALAAMLAADRRRWAAMATSYAWTENVGEVEHLAVLLQHAGVDATATTRKPEQPTLTYRNGNRDRDRRRVARAFRDAGLPPPAV
jgi:hypothetical protein